MLANPFYQRTIITMPEKGPFYLLSEGNTIVKVRSRQYKIFYKEPYPR